MWRNNLITKGGLGQEMLQDLATRPAKSCKKFCKILQDVQQDLARHPARSCTTILLLPMQESCKILAVEKFLARFQVEKSYKTCKKVAKLHAKLQD